MSIIHDDLTPWITKTEEQLRTLQSLEVHVGILSSADGEILKIARVHEFGATITPKSAKNLAIPLKPSMKGKSPRDVNGIWFLKTDDGDLFAVKNKGKDEIDFLFLLLPSVTIPERSFIRAGYDSNRDLIAQACENAVQRVITGELTAHQAASHIGVACASMIKKYMRTVGPGKSWITLASTPGKTTPLLQSGRLRDSVTYEVTQSV